MFIIIYFYCLLLFFIILILYIFFYNLFCPTSVKLTELTDVTSDSWNTFDWNSREKRPGQAGLVTQSWNKFVEHVTIAFGTVEFVPTIIDNYKYIEPNTRLSTNYVLRVLFFNIAIFSTKNIASKNTPLLSLQNCRASIPLITRYWWYYVAFVLYWNFDIFNDIRLPKTPHLICTDHYYVIT